jgi:hypothetical protein
MHAIKAYGGSGTITPLILNFCTGWRNAVSFILWLINSWGKSD